MGCWIHQYVSPCIETMHIYLFKLLFFDVNTCLSVVSLGFWIASNIKHWLRMDLDVGGNVSQAQISRPHFTLNRLAYLSNVWWRGVV